MLKTLNILISGFIFLIGVFNIDFALILAGGMLICLSMLRRIDIIYALLFYSLNYSVGMIFLKFSPENRLFNSVIKNGDHLDAAFLLTTFIIAATCFCLYIVPVFGKIETPSRKHALNLAKISILCLSALSLLGQFRVGHGIENSYVGYFFRIILILNILFPLIFLDKSLLVKVLFMSIIAVSSFMAGSRSFIFQIIVALISIGLVMNWKIKLRHMGLVLLLLTMSIYFYPIISANRQGQEYVYQDNSLATVIETIQTVRLRFAGIDIAYAFYSSNYQFPWYQIFGEFAIAVNRYFPDDFLPLPPNFYPSEFATAKLFGGYNILRAGSDELKNTESMRLGRFFTIDFLSTFFYFLIFIVSLNIQNKNKVINFLFRFYLISNWITTGGFFETFYITMDVFSLNLMVLFVQTVHIPKLPKLVFK